MSDDYSEAQHFEAMREASKSKRRSNRENSARILREKGVEFEERNNAAHLIIIDHGKPFADLWPGTGLWRLRSDATRGRGIAGLLGRLGK